MKKVTKPNLFIVGAPRSGTTAMYEYLRLHPEIFMSPYKEPHYFATDFEAPNPWMARLRKKKHYLNLFSKVRGEKQIGEASVLYLYSKDAAKNIKKYNPNSKIIITLRDPVEAMYSLFSIISNGKGEIVKTFKEALDLESERKKGRKIPNNNLIMREFYYYKDIYKYYGQIKRYFELFDKRNILILLFSDIKKNTEREYKKTLKFLGVDTNYTPTFNKFNEDKILTSGFARRILNLVSYPFTLIGPETFLFLRPIYRKIEGLFLVPVKRSPIKPSLKLKLRKEFKERNRKLEKLISRNFSSWYD